MTGKRLWAMLLAACMLFSLMGSVTAAQPDGAPEAPKTAQDSPSVADAPAADANDAPEPEGSGSDLSAGDLTPEEPDSSEEDGLAVLAEITLPGTGTADSPYLISSEADLMQVNDSPASCYRLESDIVLTADPWTPIGVSKEFSGVFDGNGHSITGLNISGSTYDRTGLFATASGTIRNLTVDGSVSGKSYVGVLVGYSKGEITNCFTSGSASNTSSSGDTGGMVGYNYSGTISACGSSASATASGGDCGGLIGDNHAQVNNSYAQGSVTGGSAASGGLIGYNAAYIRNCYACGNVTTTNSNKGALVGNNSNGEVYNCYARSITGANSAGFTVTLDDLKSKSTFAYWDFDDLWAIGSGYPYISKRGEERKITFNGEGSREVPYLIETEDQLYCLAMNFSSTPNTSDTYYLLAKDINITAVNWTPIGVYSEFKANFDGGGHKITGLTLSGTSYNKAGLFGTASGTVSNLTVDGSVSGNSYVGVLVGYSKGEITNCFTSGSAANTSSSGDTGGMVGYNYSGTISACGSSASATASGGDCGGLIGDNHAQVNNSYAQGSVTGGSAASGGLIGYNAAYVRNCYACGNVTTTNSNKGALVGNNSNGEVYNCYARSITGANSAGFTVTLDDLKSKSTFAYWDFDDLWAIGSGYPYISKRGEERKITFNGEGSREVPYLIETEDQLYCLAMNFSSTPNTSDTYYLLAKDINITAGNWTPIGVYSEFKANFDGGGHKITGLTLSGTSYNKAGLFGTASGTISNLTVDGSVSGNSYVGVLVGYSKGAITNCFTSGSAANTSSSGDTGGMVGYNYSGTVSACGSSASATASGGDCGGLIGDNHATVNNSYSQGAVSGGSAASGGLIGYNAAYVRNCYACGNVTTTNSNKGALVGNNTNGEVYNCYARSITGANSVGFTVTLDDLKSKSTFTYWDFDNLWAIDSGYPYISKRGEERKITFNGEGSREVPYLIETEDQLYCLAMNFSSTPNTSDTYYRLAKDINITAVNWTPIGVYSEFKANFDGGGHKITGLTLSGTSYDKAGLFGTVSGTVSNLAVDGSISGSSYVGILAGYSKGEITNCSVTGSAANPTASGDTGGMVGYNSSGTISLCWSTADVSCSGGDCGGLIGDTRAQVSNCYARGTVAGGKASSGGLIGYSSAAVSNCYASGAVTTTNSNRGGLIGNGSGKVTSGYYDSEVSTTTDTARGTPASTAEMKTQSTYEGWDFDVVWSLSSSVNDGYPHLRSNPPSSGGSGSDYTVSVTGVSLDKTAITLNVGETAALKASVIPDIATDQTVTWKSSSSAVATVKDGVVTAVSAGTATITVTTVDGGKTATCAVTVTPASSTVPVTQILVLIDNDDHVLTDISALSGTTRSGLIVEIYPENATDKSVVWNSSNDSVAAVSQNGLLTFKSAGTAVITVTTGDGSVSTSFTVQTRTRPDVKLTTNVSALSLAVGETETLTASADPDSICPESGHGYNKNTQEPFVWIANQSVRPTRWSSEDETVASVSAAGVVTAVKEGSTYIDIVYNEGRSLFRVPVTVYKYTAAGAYRIVSGSYTWEEARDACIAMGGHLATITSAGEQAYVQQLNSGDRKLWIGGYRDDSFNWYWVTGETWSYTNWGEGQPDNEGGRGEKYAAVWPRYWNDLVMASTEQDGFICEWDDGIIAPASVSVEPSSLELTVGDAAVLTAVVSPADATDKTVTWKSSNEAAATVDSSGTVTALTAGSAVITCTTRSGAKSAQCTVTVKPRTAGKVTLNVSKIALQRSGDTFLLIAEHSSPSGITFKWTSSNKGIVPISQKAEGSAYCLVHGQQKGNATITVRASDGATASCQVYSNDSAQPMEYATAVMNVQPAKLTLFVGSTSTLRASLDSTYTPGAGSLLTPIYWLSSDPSVADVSNGTVTALKEGTAEITAISGYASRTAICQITVKAKPATLTGIELSGPSVTQVIQGSALDVSGLTVTAVYSDGTKAAVTDYTTGGYDTNKLGAQTVTVTYKGKTASFGITVVAKEITGITVTSRPSKLSYAYGEALDTAGLAVSAVYNDGTTKTVTGYTLSGYSASVSGSQYVTVTYQGFTAGFYVTVGDKPVTGDVSKPVFSIESFIGGKRVTLSSPDGAAIYYTLDGSAPTAASARYSSPIVFTYTATLKAVAISGGVSSNVISAKITVSKAEKPTIVPPGGQVEKNSIVTLRTDTVGASIYYTTDGSAPSHLSETSRKYNGAIFVQGSMILKAVAVKDGYISSDVAAAQFTVPEPPADEVTIALGSVSVPAGNVASVPAYIFAGSDITGFRFSVSFDSNLFDSNVTITPAEGVDASELFSSANDGVVTVMYTGEAAVESGEICTINLTTMASVSAGTACSLEVLAHRSSVSLADYEKVELSAQNSFVTITEPQLYGEVMFTDSSGKLTDPGKTSDVLEASVSIYNDAADGTAEQTFANLYLAIYDRNGMMVSVDSWRVDISDPMYLFTQTVNIPKGVEVGSVKVMLLSDDMVPLIEV